MSYKVVDWVWGLDIRPNQKLVLLVYADFADHDGGGVWPSAETVAAKTGYSSRQVRSITHDLEQAGLLVPDGRGPKGTNKWRIDLDAVGGEKFSGVKSFQGEKFSGQGVKSFQVRGEKISPDPVINQSIEPVIMDYAPTLKGQGIPLPAYMATETLTDAWLRWQVYHEERGKPITRSTALKQFQEFYQWGPEKAVEAIDYSISQGYAGLYQPKQAKAKGQPKATKSTYTGQVI